jgi:hypothetical protein
MTMRRLSRNEFEGNRVKIAKIRVIPSLLLEASNELQRIGSEVEAVGDQVQTAASRAPSYEGQFGPKVHSLGSEAMVRSRKLAQDLSALANVLRNKGEDFESADLAGAEGLAGILAKLEAWLSSDRLLVLSGFSKSLLTRILNLGTLLSTGGGEVPDEEPDWEPPKWASSAICAYELWSWFDENIGQSIRDFTGKTTIRVKQGLDGIAWAFYFSMTQNPQSQMAMWINDYLLTVQEPGLPPDGPLTVAYEAMMVVGPTGDPASLVGTELVELMWDRRMNVSFIMPSGSGASPWEGRILLAERLVDPSELDLPENAALVGHELTHDLQRELNDPRFFPPGSLRFEEPNRGIVGDSTNYMEVMAYIVGETIEYDLLLQKASSVGLSAADSLRLNNIENSLATLTDPNSWNAAQSIAAYHQNCDVYLDNFVLENSLPDHRIPPGGWQHWLRETGFSDASIKHIESIAARGTPKPLPALDPNTGKIIPATPTPTITSTPISPTSTPSPTPSSTPSSTPSPSSTPTPDPSPTSTETPTTEP